MSDPPADAIRTADFSFDLPPALIARRPLPQRSASRLLVLRGGTVAHQRFDAIVDLLEPGDLLVVNDARVLKARLRGRKDSGGAVEALVERIVGEREALCQVRASKALQPGRCLLFGSERVAVAGRCGEFYRLRFPMPAAAFLERFGELPLPPYIGRTPDAADEARYQTVYAESPGAVAAPTAGLHFDDAILGRLDAKGVGLAKVTLHVGAGTFKPVRAADARDHVMHAERYEVPPDARAAIAGCRGRVVAVGTTVVRTLEAAAQSGEERGDTSLYILPGFRFRAVDALVTNFHLPASTLVMLVSAFAGVEAVRNAYRAAVAEGYRFYSYGDAMFCERGG